MDTKINGGLIKKLREEKAWSQEQLAELAGISLRTIQRVENNHTASAETRMALACVFEINAADLSLSEISTVVKPAERSISRHLFIYFSVCTGLLIFNYTQGQTITWAKWPLIIWGVILLIRTMRKRLTNSGSREIQ